MIDMLSRLFGVFYKTFTINKKYENDNYFISLYRAETVKNALDVLKVCALAAPAQLKFCEKILARRFQHITGIR